MGDLSPHFSRHEFDCHDGSRAHPNPLLIAALERARALAGNKPMEIISGFRSVAWNKKVGGAKMSQHLFNNAADLRKGVLTIEQARAAGFSGIGYSGRWAVHVDVRSGHHVEFRDD